MVSEPGLAELKGHVSGVKRYSDIATSSDRNHLNERKAKDGVLCHHSYQRSWSLLTRHDDILLWELWGKACFDPVDKGQRRPGMIYWEEIPINLSSEQLPPPFLRSLPRLVIKMMSNVCSHSFLVPYGSVCVQGV